MNAIHRLPHDWFDEPLPENVDIGERSWLYSSYAFRHYHSNRPQGVRIGHDSGLYNGTFFDLGPEGEVVIGDYCSLVGVIFSTNRRIEIGDYVFIAHEVVIADEDAAVPFEGARSSADAVSRALKPPVGTVLADNVWVGARASLVGPVRIGDGAIIGAGAVVVSDIPPFAVAAGNPARIVGFSD